VAYVVTGAVDGAGVAAFPRGVVAVGLQTVAALVMSAVTFYWYRLDARDRGYPVSQGLNMAIIGIGLIAIPYYLVRTRGVLNGTLAIVGAVGAICLPVLGVMMGALIVAIVRHAIRS
jgi:hypothetical protein